MSCHLCNGITTRQMQAAETYCGTSLYKQNVSRKCCAIIATSKSDIWDKISIQPCGEEEVFDLTVPGPHNVANELYTTQSNKTPILSCLSIAIKDTTERPNIAELNIKRPLTINR